MKVVVTGGAGFIGANLARRLSSDPEIGEITVVDDLSTGSAENLAGLDRIELRRGSILDVDLLADAVVGADAIVHLAARPSVPRSISDPLASNEVNVTGTLRVLEAARHLGGAHTIVASSSSVYGANAALPKSEDLRLEPMSPYAVSKQAAESYTVAYAVCYGLPVLPLRFFNVFGPLQPAGHAYAAVVPTFVDAALRGEPLPLEGDGEQTRDFTFVGSVVEILADAVRRRVTSDRPVNLAFGTRRTLNELIAEIERQLGRSLTITHRPPRQGDVRHSQADGTRLAALSPDIEPVEFRDGLAQTIRWFQERASAATAGSRGAP